MNLKIREAAESAGVSIRTLHHYDEIGLLRPAKIMKNGYRSYSEHDMQRLQHILFFRELEFSLSEIKIFLTAPDFDRLSALRSQHALLLKKKKRLTAIIKSIESTIAAEAEGKKMSNADRFNSFDMREIEEYKAKYSAEARKRYGSGAAWKESVEKTSTYSKEDWQRITENGNAVLAELALMMNLPADSDEVQDAVAKWRSHITDNFYDCTVEILGGLGQMYREDARFAKNIDKTAEGLSDFLSLAIQIYCKNNS